MISSESVYKRLRDVGFTKPYIRKVAALPDWWDDSLWADVASRSVGYMHLARHLGLEIRTLQDESSALRLKDFGTCKYKKRAGTSDDELLLATVIATRAAHFAAAAFDRPVRPIPSATELRADLLETAPWVGFRELLDYCWTAGIPVLHVNSFPTDARKKPVGFCLRVTGRPVIVICVDKDQPAWLLFVLAHELGHLACGHLPSDGTLVDETIHDNVVDAEEAQADRFAIELLTGQSNTTIQVDGRWPNAAMLAEMARDFGRRNHVDPGHVVLNCAHTIGSSFWGIASAALKILDPHAHATTLVGERMAANLDWNRLPEDSSEFLAKITRLESTG
jgi:hypothetical protein